MSARGPIVTLCGRRGALKIRGFVVGVFALGVFFLVIFFLVFLLLVILPL